jgi:hypothetical protein
MQTTSKIFVGTRGSRKTRPKVSLEDIWASPSKDINKCLIASDAKVSQNTLVNKIRLAQVYLKTGQLTEEAERMVSHHVFERTALEVGRLTDIISNLSIILLLEGIFNERYLASDLNSYDVADPKMLYILTDDGIQVRNLDGVLVNTIKLPNVIIPILPIYYKGKLYFVGNKRKLDSLMSVDLDNQDVTAFNDVKAEYIRSRIGNIIYYTCNNHKLNALNLETQQQVKVDIKCGGNLLYVGDLIYSQYGEVLMTYDGTTMPPTLLSRRPLPFKPEESFFDILNGRMFKYSEDRVKVYDLETFLQVGEVPPLEGANIFSVGEYGDKTYISYVDQETDDISVHFYDSVTLKHLGILYEAGYGEDIKVNGSRLYANLGTTEISIYDLETDTLLNRIKIPVASGFDNFTIG